jgi:DNA-binding IclR family transcriptional regulator
MRKALVHRIRSEFGEMRGLSLTLAQAARLFGIPLEVCARILVGLADEGLLRSTTEGRYLLRGENP